MTPEKEFEQKWNSRHSIDPKVRGSLREYWKGEETLYYLIV